MTSIYPTSLAAALPDRARIDKARTELEKAGVKYVMSTWIDILGSPKTKPVPVSEFENLCIGKGPQFAVHSVAAFPELGPADPDQIPIPDLDAIFVCPWNPEIAIVFADLFYEDAPYNVCPRMALKRTVKEAADAGYAFFAGMEPEFIVLRYDEDGQPVRGIDDDPEPGEGFRPKRQAFGYDVEYSLDSMPFLADVIAQLNGMGWGLKNVVCEGAYSQFEVDFHYADVLGMADRFTFLRILLKEVAKRHGMFVTFMPKPAQGDWRSGAHINWSVQSTANPGKNLFKDEASGGWSDAARWAVGGALKHGVALTAVNCQTVNSYKGLIGRAREFEGGTVTWAPTHITYGVNNRSAMLRFPQARFAIENRAVDMCVNPYLGLAMTCAASLEGIREKIDPGPPLQKSLYDLTGEEKGKVKPLPRNLDQAIAGFAADPLAKHVFGDTMHRLYVTHKQDEWDRFHETVTDWEKREYLRFF
ncbi:MAG: glutamine synthetase family protein [Methyloceanibacter sp.]